MTSNMALIMASVSFPCPPPPKCLFWKYVSLMSGYEILQKKGQKVTLQQQQMYSCAL